MKGSKIFALILALCGILSFSACELELTDSSSQDASSFESQVDNSGTQDENSSSQDGVVHQHSYDVEYSKDEDYHWYVCTDEECEEESGKEEHDWDDGKITTIPSPTQPGVKTFTCKDCGQTQTETLVYVPNNQVNQSAWIASFDATRLNNVTMNGYIINEKARTIPTKILVEGEKSYEYMKFSETNISESYFLHNGSTFTKYYKDVYHSQWTVAENYHFGYNGDVFLSFLPLYDKYTEFVYNSETGCYIAGAMDCTSEMFGTLKYESVVIKFEDGQLIRIEAKMRESFKTTPNGSNIMEYVFDFSNYSQTSVVIPVAQN